MIEFVSDWRADLERRSSQRMEQGLFSRGTRCCAEVRPRITEQDSGPMETADLYFDDGTIARRVPFAAFAFAD
jgi:hypothetical protein